MTKIRQPLTTQAAVRRAIAILDLERAARITGKQETTLYAYGDPEKERHISVEDALALDLACYAENGETPFTDMMRLMMESVPFAGRVDIPSDLLSMHIDVGHLSEMVIGAQNAASPEGKRLSFEERAHIKEAGYAILTRVHRVLDTLDGGDAALDSAA